MLSRLTFGSLLCVFLVMHTAVAAQDIQTSYKDTVRLIIDQTYNQGDFTTVNATFAPDFIRHPGESNQKGFMISVLSLRAAFPDMVATLDLLIQEQNYVAARLHLVGTFTNEYVTPDTLPVAPTYQPVQLVVNNIYRFNDTGQIAEEWDGFDNLSFLGQLAAIPAPATKPEVALNYPDVVLTGLEEQNKTIIRSYIDGINRADFGMLDSSFKYDFTAHNPFGSFDRSGLASDWSRLRGALPDLSVMLDLLISEGNWAAGVYTMRGTFTGAFVNVDGSPVPATGAVLQLPVVILFRFEQAGLVAESWELYDSLHFLTQLGLITIVSQDQ